MFLWIKIGPGFIVSLDYSLITSQWAHNSPRHHIDRNSQVHDNICMDTTSYIRDDATHLTYTPLERENSKQSRFNNEKSIALRTIT